MIVDIITKDNRYIKTNIKTQKDYEEAMSIAEYSKDRYVFDDFFDLNRYQPYRGILVTETYIAGIWENIPGYRFDGGSSNLDSYCYLQAFDKDGNFIRSNITIGNVSWTDENTKPARLPENWHTITIGRQSNNYRIVGNPQTFAQKTESGMVTLCRYTVEPR